MKSGKHILFWILSFVLLSFMFNHFSPETRQLSNSKIAFSEFMNSAEEGQIDTVTIIGNDIFGTYVNGTKFKTYAPFDPSMVETLRKQNVKIEAKPIETAETTFWGILISVCQLVILSCVCPYFSILFNM